MNKRDNFFHILMGKQRGGKTFLAETISKVLAQNGQTQLVYNRGKKSDFSNFESLEFPHISDIEKHIYETQGKDAQRLFKRFPEMSHFRYRGELHHLRRFNAVVKNAKLASFRVSRYEENLLFQSFYKYLTNTHIIFDDCRAITMKGLNDGLVDLISRRDQTGS